MSKKSDVIGGGVIPLGLEEVSLVCGGKEEACFRPGLFAYYGMGIGTGIGVGIAGPAGGLVGCCIFGAVGHMLDAAPPGVYIIGCDLIYCVTKIIKRGTADVDAVKAD